MFTAGPTCTMFFIARNEAHIPVPLYYSDTQIKPWILHSCFHCMVVLTLAEFILFAFMYFVYNSNIINSLHVVSIQWLYHSLLWHNDTHAHIEALTPWVLLTF